MKIIGHRGAKGLAPENTIAGLQMGLTHGVEALEFDVRLTEDGIPVLTHDSRIHAADGTTLDVHHASYESLLKHQPDLCTLIEALQAIDRQVQAIIEVKPGEDPAPVIVIVQKLLDAGWQPHDFAFIGFEYRILKSLHIAFPSIPIIVNDMWSSVRAVSRAKRLHTKQIDIFWRWLWPGVIRNLHKRGYILYTFPLNDSAKARRWKAYGLAGVITDYPDRFQPTGPDS